ncbi:MAG: DUF2085 domain-containing protein [Halobacteriaceae archaeon]
MSIDWTELRRGLARTRPYLLSHHLPENWDRCYRLSIGGRQVRICARCSGIYPGIAAGLGGALTGLVAIPSVVVIAILPLPALLDWVLTTIGEREGANALRTATGALLGFGYGLGLVALSSGRVLELLGVGLAYGLLALLAMGVAARRDEALVGF